MADRLASLDERWSRLGSLFEGIVPGLMLYRYPFQSSEFLQRPPSVKAAKAGCLLSAESHNRLVVDRTVVDMDHAGVDLFGQFGASFDVAGVDRTAQSECAVVRDPDSFLSSIKGHHANRRAKHLVLRHPHVGANVGKNGRRNHVTFYLPLQDRPGSFCNALLDLLRESVSLGFVDQRADVSLRIARIPHLEPGYPIHILLQEPGVEAAVHQNPVGRHADLPLVRKAAEYRGIERIV